MSNKIVVRQTFQKQAKRLAKRYKSFPQDLQKLVDELKENEFNLNVPRYVDISELEEEIDIQKTINELKKLEKERREIEIQITKNLTELGFKI